MSLAALALPTTARAADEPTTSTVMYWGGFSSLAPFAQGVQTTPLPISVPGRVEAVASDNTAGYALPTNGTVYAWGLGGDGQLGDGQSMDSLTQAVQVQFPPGVKIAKLPDDVMPYNEGLAIDTTGHIWGWGTDPFGDALCLGSQAPQPTPVELPLSNVTDAAGALGHARYLSNGQVLACGDNHYGELGDGTTTASCTPVQVRLPPGAQVTRMVAGFHNSGALLADGTHYDWGFNRAGQLGQGNVGGYSDTPVQVTLPGRALEVFQGGSLPANGQTLALLDDGTLYAWGAGSHYQLGTGTTAAQPTPVAVPLPAGLHFTKLAGSLATSYGITANGDVCAWGFNRYGQVGDGTRRDAKAPTFIIGGASGISGTDFDVVISPLGSLSPLPG